jgi:hypothetical protein
MSSHDAKDIVYYGPFGTFSRFFVRIEGLNNNEYGNDVLVVVPLNAWNNNSIREEICKIIAKGRPYEVLDEREVFDNNSELYYLYQRIDKELNLSWGKNELSEIGIDSDFLEELNSFDKKTRIRAMADVVAQHGHPEIKELKD